MGGYSVGDEADWLIEQEIFGWAFEDDYVQRRRKVEATEVAEEAFDDAKSDKKLKELNKGVIEW